MEDRLADELGCAMTPWQYNDPKKFSQGHGKFSETAVYARGNAFPWRMAEIQCSDEATEIATARLMAAAPDLYAALDDLLCFHTDGRKRTQARRLAVRDQARSALAKAKGED